MPGPAQEAVTGPGVTLQAPGLNKIVEPKQHGQVDLPGRGLPTGKPLPPTTQPVVSKGGHLGLVQPGLDGTHQGLGVIQSTDSLKMEVKVLRAGRTTLRV